MTKLAPIFIHFSFYLTFFLFLSHANSQLSAQEQGILKNLKQLWGNPKSLRHWIPTNFSSHCSWPEITCSSGSIVGLSFRDYNINGTIPPFICNLKNLTTIDVYNNSFHSTEFPRALYNCSKLEILDLSQNYFYGAIPDDIYRMSQLRELSLGGNNFDGNISTSIGRLTELRKLILISCPLTGSFPLEIGNLSNLDELSLAYNSKIVSTFPSEFGKLKKLKFLWMARTNLIGKIPNTIGEMTALEHLDFLFMLKNLKIVYLYKNKLFEEIPRVVEALNLDEIDLSENNFTRAIPDDFGKLKNLTSLTLFFNQLSGKIPDSIGRLPRLVNLKLFNNIFLGSLPPELGRYSMLERLWVSTNRLTGQLPEHLCDNGKLVEVITYENQLIGELPKSFGNYSSLELVKIYKNGFSGNIPSGLWTSSNLKMLMLSDNSFIGELPERLAWSLTRLEMNNNRFLGQIPQGVSFSKNLLVLMASNNLFNGTIPRDLSQLTILLLDRNQISGSLPSDINSWKSLNALNLSRNAIFGQIPEELGSLPSLIELDLSENQLSGLIPSKLGLLKLTSLNLSSNHLTGSIPSEFENDAYAYSFLNNSGLCADRPSQSLNLKNCSSHHQNASQPKNQPMYKPSPRTQCSPTRPNPRTIPFRVSSLTSAAAPFTVRRPPPLQPGADQHHAQLTDPSPSENRGCSWLQAPPPRLKAPDACILRWSSAGHSKNSVLRKLAREKQALPMHFSGVFTFILTRTDLKAVGHLVFNLLHHLDHRELRFGTEQSHRTLALRPRENRQHLPKTSGPETPNALRQNPVAMETRTLGKEFLAKVKILSSIQHVNIVKLLCCISCDNSKLLV
ncbi:hypothetical protein I3843_04G146100 [Carya illinoinensis]|nr:hypothetical protein I3843_04G146100 [Carya illinoinensis]